jgi:hypothetical protein
VNFLTYSEFSAIQIHKTFLLSVSKIWITPKPDVGRDEKAGPEEEKKKLAPHTNSPIRRGDMKEYMLDVM